MVIDPETNQTLGSTFVPIEDLFNHYDAPFSSTRNSSKVPTGPASPLHDLTRKIPDERGRLNFELMDDNEPCGSILMTAKSEPVYRANDIPKKRKKKVDDKPFSLPTD